MNKSIEPKDYLLINQIKELGIIGDDLLIYELLHRNQFNLEKSINEYFEKGLKSSQMNITSISTNTNTNTTSTTNTTNTISSICSNSGINKNNKNSIVTSIHSSSISNQSKTTKPIFYFIGRRNITAYALNAGYLIRNQSLQFVLEGKKRNHGNDKISSNHKFFQKSNKLYAKNEKFSGGKLYFETKLESSLDDNMTSLPIQEIRGRLPNGLCNILLPLLYHQLIDLRGNITFDIGSIPTFSDVPITLYIGVTMDFFHNLMENNVNENNRELIEAANDLLIWLAEGDTNYFNASNGKVIEAIPSTISTKSLETSTELLEEEALEASTEETERVVDGLLTNKSNDTCDLEEAKQPSLFVKDFILKRYQLQTLHFMQQRESTNIQSNVSKFTFEVTSKLVLRTNGLIECKDLQTYQSKLNSEDSLWTPIISLPLDKIPFIQKTNETLESLIPNEDKDMMLFWWNQFSQRIQTSPPCPPKPCNGGILALAMGLGKTLCALAIIASDYEHPLQLSNNILPIENHKEDVIRKRSYEGTIKQNNDFSGTLVICPMTLLQQWYDEINSKLQTKALSILMYYGDKRKSSSNRELVNADIVLTSYGSLVSELKNNSNDSQGLFSISWRRIILDEAHIIRNSNTEVSKACNQLHGLSRWTLTGTPINNSLHDLYSLIKFLRHEPWNELKWWNKTVMDHSHGPNAKGMVVLRHILSEIMMRMTKYSIDNKTNQSILQLPNKNIYILKVKLLNYEREFYETIYQKSKSVFLVYDKPLTSNEDVTSLLSGRNHQVLGNTNMKYAKLFALLMRIRQACDHPYLCLRNIWKSKSSKNEEENEVEIIDVDEMDTNEFLTSLHQKLLHSSSSTSTNPKMNSSSESSSTSNSKFIEEALHRLKQLQDKKEEFECPICFDELAPRTSTITSCGHMLCKRCAIDSISKTKLCPICQQPVNVRDLTDLSSLEPSAPISPVATTSSPIEDESILRWSSKANSNIKKTMSWFPSSKIEVLMTKIEELFSLPSSLSKTKPSFMAEKFQSPSSKKANTNGNSIGNGIGIGNGNGIDNGIGIGNGIGNGNSIGNSLSLGKQDQEVNEIGCKIVIFSQWTAMLDLVEEAFEKYRLTEKYSIGFTRLDGSMSQNQRSKAIELFNSNSKTKIMLMSLKAGGVGLNLTVANVVFLLDPWWNPSTEDQAIDRVHRLGQQKEVYVYRLICESTVEERLLQLQDNKRSLSLQALDNNMTSFESAKLTLNELRSFFM